MKKEILWEEALAVTQEAINCLSIIPLKTQMESINNSAYDIYEIRHLLTKPPLIDKVFGPKINPFKPWDEKLSISKVLDKHQLILNKYPVQIAHMLLITTQWKPQIGWLDINDFKALISVNNDTTGLWFFNSGPKAGASQPHRHIQLLPRRLGELICPRELWFADNIKDNLYIKTHQSKLNGSFLVEKIDYHLEDYSGYELYKIYLKLCYKLGIGNYPEDKIPILPYNLLLTSNWICIIKRSNESSHGFSINSLGFAGYLLSTSKSDINWLKKNNLESLLSTVINKD